MASIALLLLLATPAFQHPPPTQDADWAESGEFVFLNNELTHITVTMDEGDLDDFLANPYLDVYATCSVHIVNSKLDETHDNVGIRPRGNSQRGSDKAPWKLSFNTFVPGRQFHGIEKMNLNSESTDPSMSRESLAYEVMRSFGLPASRTTHVWLTINDGTKVKGVFNSVEQVDEEFIEAWFGNNDGELYKCRWKQYGAKLQWISPGDPYTYEVIPDYEEKFTGSYQLLADFIDFVTNSDNATFANEIGNWINVDSFLRAQATDCYLGQWDGIWVLPNNYYLYFDTETGLLEYIPWDLDHCMGMDYFFFPIIGNWGTNWATRSWDGWGIGAEAGQPGNNDGPPIIRRLLAIPEYQNQIFIYFQELADRFAHPGALLPSCEMYEDLLASWAYTGTFSGGSMENGYRPSDFAESWTQPSSYEWLTIPATWGIQPFLEARQDYVRSNFPQPQPLPPVVVNEIVPDNETGISDEAGDFDDWVELFNPSAQSVDISGFWLSDRYGSQRKWPFPSNTVIGPGEYLTIWCDGEPTEGPLHTNFKLSKTGEGVYLFAPIAGKSLLVSSLVFPEVSADKAFGRIPDASTISDILPTPTPEAPNSYGSFELIKEGYCPGDVTFHGMGGTPNGPIALVYSQNTGSFTVGSNNPCTGITLGLSMPTLGHVATADALGAMTLHYQAPANLAGIWIQGVDVSSCAISSLVQL
ncbi:MAG TPA: hypothetical protein DDW23_02985 [Planctomycetes bacterium]|nr:hypothetical protein [Planctomycetota bacterium]